MTVSPEIPPATEKPLDRKKAHQFTPDNARQMQLRGAAARSIYATVRKLQRSQPLDDSGKPRPLSLRQIMVAEEIERVRVQLKGDIEPNERANLIRALDLLLDRERVLAGEPLPGSRKPGPANRTAPHVLAQPLDEVNPTVS